MDLPLQQLALSSAFVSTQKLLASTFVTAHGIASRPTQWSGNESDIAREKTFRKLQSAVSLRAFDKSSCGTKRLKSYSSRSAESATNSCSCNFAPVVAPRTGILAMPHLMNPLASPISSRADRST
jgi:hypothetical protein